MKIAVLGTGNVGRTLAGRLASLGHSVMLGTRDPEATRLRLEPDRRGGLSFQAWAELNPAVTLGSFTSAAAHAELVINATDGSKSLEALHQAGEDNLNSKTLVDVSNPLDFSAGFPPSLFTDSRDSLAEQIQRAFPAAMVVKTLNTVTAALMVDPGKVGNGDHTIFVSGNDITAKARVIALLRSFGWKDIIDLGDITTARGPEMYLPLWLRLSGSLGTGMINARVVR